MKILALAFTIISLCYAGHAQVRTLKWNGDMCTFTGTFNSKKYSAEQLLNTARLFTYGNFELSHYDSVFKYEDIAKLDVSKLDAEYAKKSAELNALQIVDLPYWQTVKQRKIKEMDQSYALRRTRTLAYRDPKVLREYNAAPSCNAKYVEPLIASGDSLMKVWLDVNVEGRARNCCPKDVKAKFDQQMASPDREKFAFVEVMAFGWGNCANSFVEYDELANDGTYLKEFKKLFIRVKEVCEEP